MYFIKHVKYLNAFLLKENIQEYHMKIALCIYYNLYIAQHA